MRNKIKVKIPWFSRQIKEAHKNGLRAAAQLVREYENEHNKHYREALAQYIEGKAK